MHISCTRKKRKKINVLVYKMRLLVKQKINHSKGQNTNEERKKEE